MAETSDENYDRYVRDDPPSAPELRRLFSPGRVRTVFDIGACEGEDSLRYARLFPRARVHTFEPLPQNQQTIRRQFARHGAERCELIPLALSDQAGTARFHVSSGEPPEKFSGEQWNYGNKSSSLLPPAGDAALHGWIEFKQEVEVRTETLARHCADRGITRIDFLHVDVQGAEMLVLRGAGPMLARTGAVWLEVSDQVLYRGQALRPEIERFMRAAGFALACEFMNGIEGDQFYVNLRRPGAWVYLARRRLAAAAAWLRFNGGRWKSRLLGR